jgi:hypothetical protein
MMGSNSSVALLPRGLSFASRSFVSWRDLQRLGVTVVSTAAKKQGNVQVCGETTTNLAYSDICKQLDAVNLMKHRVVATINLV